MKPKPSWTLEGRSVAWDEYLAQLQEEGDWDALDRAQIELLAATQEGADANPRSVGGDEGYGVESAPESLWHGWEPPRRKGAGRGRDPDRALLVHREGEPRWERLENDVDAIEATARTLAAELGHALEDLVPALRRGRLTAAEQERRRTLARIVHELRGRDANLQAIADVLGCNRSTALRLARAGASG